jgi:hypothetical protein
LARGITVNNPELVLEPIITNMGKYTVNDPSLLRVGRFGLHPSSLEV